MSFCTIPGAAMVDRGILIRGETVAHGVRRIVDRGDVNAGRGQAGRYGAVARPVREHVLPWKLAAAIRKQTLRAESERAVRRSHQDRGERVAVDIAVIGQHARSSNERRIFATVKVGECTGASLTACTLIVTVAIRSWCAVPSARYVNVSTRGQTGRG